MSDTLAHGLYIVATPIGNLRDMSPRAIATLQGVTRIYAEDTRSFRKLAQQFGIATEVRSYHEHNERTLGPMIASELAAGEAFALVSDAGTPAISDPGYRLIASCQELGVSVFTIPGPCACIAAISICGFETDRFYFEGFLPQKPGKKKTALQEAIERDCLTAFYESPHRILQTLETIAALDSEREVAVGRELTKMHEELLRGTAEHVRQQLIDRQSVRGEFVLLIRRKPRRSSLPAPHESEFPPKA